MTEHFRWQGRAIVLANLALRCVVLLAVMHPLLLLSKVQPQIIDYLLLFCLYEATFVGWAAFVLGVYWVMGRVHAGSARWVSVGLEVGFWLFWLTDLFVYRELGIHLDSPLVFNAFLLEDLNFGVTPQPGHVAAAIAALLLTAALQALAVRNAHRLRAQAASRPVARRRGWLARVVLYAGAATAGLALFKAYDNASFLPLKAYVFGRRIAGDGTAYPMPPVKLPKQPERIALGQEKPDIVLVMVDSLRADAFAPGRMPLTTAKARALGCRVAESHYPGGHLTQTGTFSLLYGLDGYYAHTFIYAGARSAPLRILTENGYRLAAFDSIGVASYRPRLVHREDFAVFFESISDADRAKTDRQVVEQAIDYLTQPARTDPALATVLLFATHNSYYCGQFCDRQATGEVNRYWQATRHVDVLTTELLTALESRIRAGKLLLFFTSDHGEELGEQGGTGHIGFSVRDALLKVPFFACGDGFSDPAPLRTLTTHADILASALRRLGAGADQLATHAISGLPTLLAPARNPVRREFVVVSEPYFPETQRQVVLVTDARKYLLLPRGTALISWDLMQVYSRDGLTEISGQEQRQLFRRELQPKFEASFGRFFGR